MTTKKKDEDEISPETRAIRGWWSRVMKELASRGYKVTVEYPRESYRPIACLVNGIDFGLEMLARKCDEDWSGKKCKRAYIAFGKPQVKFFERKGGYDVQMLADKAEDYFVVAEKAKEKQMEIKKTQEGREALASRLNKEFGVPHPTDNVYSRFNNHRYHCDSSWHSVKLPLKFHIDTEVTEVQARKLLKACNSILGPAVKEVAKP